ncbi:protein pygopus [Trichinella spiralis]|uniref:protein pygopus n=1 Tax=Trichinella spiralis TaxID=6334 RepID=UPI0001EFC5FB|nr:protein pygopus [Trichinella spiralis]
MHCVRFHTFICSVLSFYIRDGVTSRCWKFMAKTSPDTVVLSNPFDDTPTKKCTTPTVLVGPMQAKQAPGYMPVNSMAMMMQVENGAPPPLNSLSSLSARVYPSDQPMIFTSSNPNAPPICPCGKCHREIHDNDQAIQCYRGCKFWFHRTCVGLLEEAWHMVINEPYAEWVCDSCLATKQIPCIK